MKSDNQKVIAVIPHYNMPQTLVPLLKQAITQKYDAIYVLDDHSTNCDVQALLKPFGTRVTLIAGDKNKGAGANRNRILQADLKGAFLHFIDADCELLTENIPDAARKILSDPNIGAASGTIYNLNGAQMEFNYFPRLSWRGGLSGMLMMVAIMSGRTQPNAKKQMSKLMQRLLSDYPNPYKPLIAKNVFAVAEANMFIPYDTFASVHGFDASLRFAEGQDLGFKLAAKKLTVRFDPSIAVKHHSVILADRRRGRAMLRDYFRLARKYGLSWK